MRFRTRNAYYLRISANTILPLYLYLDEQHVEWMSERILQLVLEDLRLRIPEKIVNEADIFFGNGNSSAHAKQSSLDVHRGESYQFGYFLRKADPHAVVVKSRRFVLAPPTERIHQPPVQPSAQSEQRPPTPPKRKRGKTKRKAEAAGNAKKKRKTKGKQRATSEDEEDVINITSDEDEDITVVEDAPQAPRRSTRTKKVVAGGYKETEDDGGDSAAMDVDAPPQQRDPVLDDPDLVAMDETEDNLGSTGIKAEETETRLQTPAPISQPVDSLVIDEDEDEKPKPVLKLNYQGFSIHGQCLCVIVEPYPPIRSAPKPMSLVREGLVAPGARAPSIAPLDYLPPGEGSRREKTPLFLPEDDGERGITPAPFQRNLPPVPRFHEDPPSNEDEEDAGGLFELSQVLRSVGGHSAMAAEDDDEIEGAVFFGDADEAREL